MAKHAQLPDPDVEEGIKYWTSQPASYDGVLGGFGNGSLPRIDALGSRQFLLHLRPDLSTVPSALRPLTTPDPARRTRALDVGAGVGRVTADVLLHLFHDVVLLEPVEPFVRTALARASSSLPSAAASSENELEHAPWKGLADARTSVTFLQGTLQAFDPVRPLGSSTRIGRVGYAPEQGEEDEEMRSGFDVVWCQWCLGCLSDPDLVVFLRRARAALRDPAHGLVVVKENLCHEDGQPRSVFDESDSSLTRSDLAWKKCFEEAGLKVVHQQIQRGFPEGLYDVKMYALR